MVVNVAYNCDTVVRTFQYQFLNIAFFHIIVQYMTNWLLVQNNALVALLYAEILTATDPERKHSYASMLQIIPEVVVDIPSRPNVKKKAIMRSRWKKKIV